MSDAVGPRVPRALLIAAALSAAGAFACAVWWPDAFFPAYLAAVCAASAVPIGCLPLLMTGTLVPGRPLAILRPWLEAGVAGLPLIGVLFVPALIGLRPIYPWARGPVEAHVPAFRALWLSAPFFVLRTVVYFAVFTGIAVLLARASGRGRARIASVGLIVFILLGTFAATDWMLSVETKFHSSIFGLLVMSGQLLGAFAFALVAAWCGGALSDDPKTSAGLGGLFLSLLLFWAYLHAMQFIVVWAGNIPFEVDWYARRGSGLWGVVATALALFGLVGPFLLLLLSPVRNSPAWLLPLAVLTLVLRFVETAWLTLPVAQAPALPLALSWLVSVALIGTLWIAFIVRRSVARLEKAR